MTNKHFIFCTVVKMNKGKEKLLDGASTSSVIGFFQWIENFIVKGTDLGYSYQRNLFTLQIFESLLTTFYPSEKSLKVRMFFF